MNVLFSLIDCLVVVTQNPDGDGLPHTSAIVHAKLNLKTSCAVFDISLGCSGYVYSLSIIKSFMESNSLKNGLLFTCDPYSKIIDINDKNTSMLFGDAATVTMMNTKPKLLLDKFIFATSGIEDSGFGLFVDVKNGCSAFLILSYLFGKKMNYSEPTTVTGPYCVTKLSQTKFFFCETWT